ncbi:MAG TPA: phosphotransferase [Intrasporangiaceae bacterium]|nr:phosphotransferase [Intrasporangiaceae bacterium]
MDRSLRLAALASAAVPGLDPMSVQEVVLDAEELFDVAFIQDTQQRRWVIRAPRTEVAAAHLDASLAMLALLVRRVPFAVPAAKGFAPIPKIGRAAVHAFIPGSPLDLAALTPTHPLTAQLGRTIALIHNVDRALFDEAGLASYDAQTYRQRHVAEIDRGAATGRVPAALLARWEEALDDVRLWRFAPTPVHGDLSGSDVLVTFSDPRDPASATIRGVTGWDAAKVADPADDFAALLSAARSDVVDAVLRAYAHVRVERPDEHLLARARLGSELTLLGRLLHAVATRNDVLTEATTARLRRLDDMVHDPANSRRLQIVPAPPVSGGVPSTPVQAPEGRQSTDQPGADSSAADVSAADVSSSGDDRVDVDRVDASDDEPRDESDADVDGDATDVIDSVAEAVGAAAEHPSDAPVDTDDAVDDAAEDAAGAEDPDNAEGDATEADATEAHMPVWSDDESGGQTDAGDDVAAPDRDDPEQPGAADGR